MPGIAWSAPCLARTATAANDVSRDVTRSAPHGALRVRSISARGSWPTRQRSETYGPEHLCGSPMPRRHFLHGASEEFGIAAFLQAASNRVPPRRCSRYQGSQKGSRGSRGHGPQVEIHRPRGASRPHHHRRPRRHPLGRFRELNPVALVAGLWRSASARGARLFSPARLERVIRACPRWEWSPAPGAASRCLDRAAMESPSARWPPN